VQKLEITLEEAMRRASGMLVRRGYQATDKWTNKYYEDKEKMPLWSMALVGLPNTRVLLWQGKDYWRAVICVRVGKDGEFPLAEAIITRNGMTNRFIKAKTFPTFDNIAKGIQETVDQVARWNWSSASPYAHIALARLSNYFIEQGVNRKAMAVNNAIIRGEILGATISEALSMIQEKYAKSREDRLASALIWGEVYR
jgi:hypothetical protein